jgi:hypothetical protein
MNIHIPPEDIYTIHDIHPKRIVGGMAWPASKPGFAVVLGEERLPRKGGNVRHIHVLAETIDDRKQHWLGEISELQAMYKTSAFYGRSDEANLAQLYLYNGETVRKGKVAIDFYAAPYSHPGTVEIYSDLIIKALRPTGKYLHLHGAETAKYLVIPPDERTSATSLTHPAVAALGYALAVMELYPLADESEPTGKEEDDLDPLTGY